MLSAKDGIAARSQFLADHGGCVHVTADDSLCLFPTFRRVDGFSGALSHVTHTVELGALAAVPHRAELAEFMRNNRVCAADTRKASGLAEATEFNGACASPRNLVNGMRKFFVADVAIVGSIEQNNCARFVCVIDELLERFAAEHRSRRIVGAAKIN